MSDIDRNLGHDDGNPENEGCDELANKTASQKVDSG